MIFHHLVLFLLMFALSLYANLAQATLDAIFASSPDRTCLGDGTGSFSCNDVIADADASSGVALGYVNSDTFLDAVFAPSRVCLGSGTGHFTCSNIIGGGGVDVALGDMNGDTFLDAVFASNGTNRVCLGDGTGRFTCSDVSDDAYNSRGVALGDVNGDAFLDAVFANGTAPVGGSFPGQPNQICLGDGGGRFTCSRVSSTGLDHTQDVALGDVNGDAFLDAVFANSGFGFGELNAVCLGDGTGSFICSGFSGDISYGVALGDVNGDTILDAVFANDFSPLISGENQVCLGDGTGRFTCSDISADSNFSLGVALGDVNSDTFLDAVFANRGTNRVCLGDGTGSFTCSDVSADADASRDVALGEVDQAAVTAPTAGIPALSLWAWFLLSILLAGTAMIMLRTVL